jgi:RHS repeat-associated protein
MLYQVQVSGGDNWSSGPYLYDGAGNVKRIGSQRYKYDRMSRLVEGEVLVGAQEKTQSLAYDAFGNILSLNTDGSFQSTPTSNSTNRLNNAEYDAGGNLTDITLSGETYEYTYDPLNMMKYLQSDTGQARVFLYDADDERIMTFDCAFVDGDCAVPAQLTTKIRGLDGKVLRIYNQPFGGTWNWERDYVYRDGQLLASVEPRAGGGEDTVHFHLDHLGSPRQVTDEFGAQAAFHTYYPLGGEATEPSQDDVELKFTGHERDDNGSSGAGVLDYMLARYCAPALGRFTSIDPKTRRTFTVMPQRWNRFSYSAGNPLKFVDPDGRDIFYANEKDRLSYEKYARRNYRVRAVLDAFAPGTGRDLYINRGDPGKLKDGTPLAAIARITTGREPDSQAMVNAWTAAGGGKAGENAANAVAARAEKDVVKAVIVRVWISS